MHLRPTPVALALSLAFPLAFPPAFAQTPASTNPPTAESPQPLGELTVSATRTERSIDAVPNTVTVKNRKQLERRDARDLKDLLSDEVDLDVKSTAPRFTAAGASTGRPGNEGLNIRGLEGNRVLMMVDGIRLPQGYAFGAFASGRADFVDLNSLSSVEVLRGPTSTSYGSDGLAGALSLRTLSPEDLLVNGKTFAGFARLGAASVDNSRQASAAVAFGGGDWSSLVQATVRRGHETKNEGDNDARNANRTRPNPADVDSNSVMAKVGYRVNANHRLSGTLEHRERKVDTDVLSAITAPPASGTLPATAVLGLTARDRSERTRASIEHRYEDLNATWLQQATTHLYVQDSETRQFSFEDRNAAADRTRLGTYKERLVGLSAQAQTQLASQRLSYGVDVSRNTIEGVRDGTVPPAGETFPSKPFPDTTYTLAGAFVQDEIEAGDFSVIPALRLEHYKLKPKSAGYSGNAAPLSDHAVTPRVGVIWRALPALQPYVQWAQGFRARAGPGQQRIRKPAAGLPLHRQSRPEGRALDQLGARPARALRAGPALAAERLRQPLPRLHLAGAGQRLADAGRPGDLPVRQPRAGAHQGRRGARGLGPAPGAEPQRRRGEVARPQRLQWRATPAQQRPAAARPARRALRIGPVDGQCQLGPQLGQEAVRHLRGAAHDPVRAVEVRRRRRGRQLSPLADLDAGRLRDQPFRQEVLALERRPGRAGNAAGLAVVDAFTAPGRAVQVSLRADF